MKSKRSIHNILIIKPGAVGDSLQLTPVIRALKGAYPESTITLIVGSSTTADLFRHNPRVSETIVFEKKRGLRSVLSLLSLWRELRRKNFDLVLNFQRSNLKTWFLASAAFPCRMLVYHKTRKPGIHAVKNYMGTISPLGVAASDLTLELYPGKDDIRFAKNLFSAENNRDESVIALNPGATHPVNRWGTDQFAELADSLSRKLSVKIILIGGIEDISLADEIAAKTKEKPLIITGKTSLLQLGAILKKCAVLVTGDTGPMHVASAVGTRVVALFGAADPARTGPVGKGHVVIQAKDVSCIPCRSRRCINDVRLECMKKITVEEVFRAVAGVLKARRVNQRRSSIWCMS